jgi:hypothetical protein
MLFAQALSAEVLLEEVKRMRQIFSEQVQKSPVQENYAQLLATLSKESLSSQPEGLPSASQFFLIIDRSPRAQTASFAFFDANSRSVSILGTDKTSTGKASRLGSFETPVGVFKNTVYNPSYRALGTKNDKGWRGLGATGSRVWDFGWQKTKTRKGEDFNIRLLVHATDPDHGEKRLGIQDSQGCIRLSAKFNRFLDYYGILDAEYEKNEKAKWVLLKKREPSLLAGSLVIVVDSSP